MRLLGGGRFPFLRRLQALYHHGWLERPRSQIEFYHRGGSRPMVYGLGWRGAQLARRELGASFPGKRWRGGNALVGRLFLDHTLMIADILISLELFCREPDAGMGFIAPDALESRAALKDGFHWSVWLDGIPVGLVPDAVFAIETVDGHGRRDRVVCFLEADRGTMPVHRRDRHQSSVGRKLSAYAALWKNGTFEKQFGTGRFAVFLVTPGAERAGRLREAAGSLPEGGGLFSCHTLDEALKDPRALLKRCAARDSGPVR